MKKQFKDQIAPFPYDPAWLIKLAEKQIPEETEIIASLKSCTTIVGFCECGCGDPYFIEPDSSDWDFDYNKILEREDGIDIILDVMRNKRIGSIEIGEWHKKH
ncbi:MAG: hypothetical protein OEV42_14180 [Deltaproteobacteria bacterium]|nr:hypothetical protein [Deltaproteobacteria bacterium]